MVRSTVSSTLDILHSLFGPISFFFLKQDQSTGDTSVEWTTAVGDGSVSSPQNTSEASVSVAANPEPPAQLEISQSHEAGSRSRTSSISSQASEASSLFTPVTMGHRHHLPSDVESISEVITHIHSHLISSFNTETQRVFSSQGSYSDLSTYTSSSIHKNT